MRQFLIVHMGYIICLCIIWHHITQNVYGLADSGFATCVPKSQKIIYCDTNEYNFLIVCAIVTGSGISIAGGGGGVIPGYSTPHTHYIYTLTLKNVQLLYNILF